jgi:uncharacterized membrane protein YdbT with pleckstrin-like domain
MFWIGIAFTVTLLFSVSAGVVALTCLASAHRLKEENEEIQHGITKLIEAYNMVREEIVSLQERINTTGKE